MAKQFPIGEVFFLNLNRFCLQVESSKNGNNCSNPKAISEPNTIDKYKGYQSWGKRNGLCVQKNPNCLFYFFFHNEYN